MSSIHRQQGRKFWFCAYTDHSGKRRFKSTGTTDKREAARICGKLQEIEDRASTGRLTADRARKVIETAVGEIMESFGSPIERKTLREHFTSWLKTFEAERSEGTFKRYAGVVDNFIQFMGDKADTSLAALKAEDVERYRDHLHPRLAPGTVNVHLKVIRVALEKAVKQNIFDRNPARLVDNVDPSDRHERRAFSLPELKKLIAVCGDDWKTAVLFGIYSGLRLGDIQSLTWSNLDLQQNELTIRTQKTGRVQILPLAKPLLRHIEALPTSDNPKAPICPGLQEKSISHLSNEFYEIMASAGLVQSRQDHRKKKSGRTTRRQMSELTFHSLRHTATSLLKNAGVSSAITMDIIGHESEAISRSYTHIESETKRAALDKMPDVTGTS